MTNFRARVSAVHRASLQLLLPETTTDGSPQSDASLVDAVLDHALLGNDDPLSLPTIGDWVTVQRREDRLVVVAIEPRVSTLVRRAAGRTQRPQLLAANVDSAFVFSPLPAPPNVRRLARLVSLAIAGGVAPVVVISRSDTVDDATRLDAIEKIAAFLPEVPLVTTSALSDDGVHPLAPWCWPGATIVLLGPSGAGKSTLLNRLAGREVMQTGDLRNDGAGRHTTTYRALFVLPSGITVIDTPGLREVGVWAAPEVTDALFADIGELAGACRFRDCAHHGEPGCAVRDAVARGEIDADRYTQWEELRREAAHAQRSAAERKQRERAGSLVIRRFPKKGG